jgi:S-adenosylmethionine hydrolase
MAPASSHAPLIVLTTDYGHGSPYVGALKGSILTVNPAAVIVDLTHGVPPQDIAVGAWTLLDHVEAFPSGTIHVVVVDPGVGTTRRAIFAEIGPWRFVAPDNGLLNRLARRWPILTIRELTEPRWWRERVSNTFHGRDVFGPVAAHLSLGLDPTRLGPPLASLIELAWPEVIVVPGKIQGAVRSVDSLGNLVTDITAEALRDVPTDESVRIECDEHETLGIYKTYGDQPEMTLMALVGSSGFLELSIVGDSAAIMLGVRPGAKVTVRW